MAVAKPKTKRKPEPRPSKRVPRKPAPVRKDAAPAARPEPAKPPYRRVPLAVNTIGPHEIAAAEACLHGGHVTQGPKVAALEAAVLNLLGNPSNRSVAMVNSGSSALLLAAAMLRQQCQRTGDHRNEVIIPAVCWSTTAAPFIQHGFRPLFVDVGPDYCLNPKLVDRAVTDRTVAIVTAHMLGNACDMDWASKVATRYGLTLIEDCCEALGTAWRGRAVGSWGQAACFSTYFSHHMTTIEGGFIVYDSLFPEVKAWREHGWIREYPETLRRHVADGNKDLDPRWVFDKLGWNLRSTDLNAAIGLAQLPRLASWKQERQRVAKWYDGHVKHASLEPRIVHEKADANPFSYPVMIRAGADYGRHELVAHLEASGVETRQVMTGNITRHPWYMRHTGAYSVAASGLAQADAVHERGFLIPCRPGMSTDDLQHIAGAFESFFEKQG